MDLFDDMEFNEQLDRLEQLDELRAEIHMDMDIELNVGQLGDAFDLRVDRGGIVVNPQPEGMEQAAGDAPGRNRQEADNLDVGAGDPEVQPVENQNGAANGTGESTNKPSEDNSKEDQIEAILTPKGTEMKGFSCMICYDPFNTGKRIPKVFPCGHTFCLSCVGGLMKNRTYLSRSTVVCPTCRQNTQYPMTLNPEKVPTNYSVLSMLEQRKEESNTKTEKEMLECNTCHEVLDGEKVTLCNESECQNISDEGKLLGTDSIKRMKCLLVCSTCIEKNHSRHNFTPFVKVVAQYEANQKICSAESHLVKAFKAADDALIGLKLAETELLDHRRRMANAIENIRSQADHPMIYEYLNRFTTSVKASEQLFKRLTGDMNGFDFISKSRYYRAFGIDSLRPISITPTSAGSKGALEPKQEPVDEANIRPRADRVPRGLNRDMARRARLNVFGPFHARRAGALGPDMDFPNIGNMFDQIMQQLDVAVDPFGNANRGLFGQPAENAANAANAANDANAAPANAAGAEPQNNAAVQDPAQIRGARNPLGNRFDMWGVRAPFQHRRNVRNENWRDFRGIRLRLEAARDANAALQVPEIQQVIDELRDRGDNILDNDLRGRRPPLLHPHADMVREFELAEGHLNRLRVRLDRLNRDNVRDEHPPPPADVAEPAPVRFVDQIIDEPLPQLPPIDGYNQEQIQRAEIVELVRRVSAMVRNEAHAEADANGQPLPNNYRLPLLLNPDENPGAPDHRNLLPHQVEPFLIDLRALELEWIQRGRDRRARAALVVQEAAQVNQPPNDAEAENNVVRGGNQRAPSPIPDEPAAKRHRR